MLFICYFYYNTKNKDCRDVSAQEAYIIESKEVITKTETIEIGQYTVKLYIPEAADAVFQTGNILITGD
jgi:hypothetical protein